MPKYTMKAVEVILDAVRNGATITTAAVAAGVTPRSIQMWMHQHPAFNEALEQAKAQCITENLANIKQHSSKCWTASAWILERLDPATYGKNMNTDVADAKAKSDAIVEALTKALKAETTDE